MSMSVRSSIYLLSSYLTFIGLAFYQAAVSVDPTLNPCTRYPLLLGGPVGDNADSFNVCPRLLTNDW